MRRIIDTELYREEMRGADIRLRYAVEWLWKNCDTTGFWAFSDDFLREVGYPLDADALAAACSGVRLVPGGIMLVDFAAVQITKPTRNRFTMPAKPATVSERMWDAVMRWMRYKAERRDKLTPSYIDAFLKKWAKVGEDRAIAAIDNSIAQGWAGVYESRPAQVQMPGMVGAERRTINTSW